MKSLVIFDSSFGNTQKIAEILAAELGTKAVKVADFNKKDLEGIEMLIVGSPINGWRPTPAITDFLKTLQSDKLNGIKATAFDTRIKLFIHGDAKDKIASELKNAGAEIIASSQAFYVKGTNGPLFDGELEKAKDWAKKLKS